MDKLNQVVAVEKGIKSRSYAEITNLHKSNQKPDNFNGFVKQYSSINDDGETFPNESKKVLMNVDESLNGLKMALKELLDISLTKDIGNCKAFSDLTIGDSQISVPATFLLFLEKQITDIKTFVSNLPVLDGNEDWTKDDNTGLYKSNTTKTHRTKKTVKPIVLYDATDKHPAQCQLINEDITVGYWNVTKHSGAIPEFRKKEILNRIEEFADQVKKAREKANMVEVENKEIGFLLFNYLFK